MKAEIILRVKICQFSQEKTSALWKNFKLKFTLLLLCQQKAFLVEEQISNLKKKMTEADRRHSWHTLEGRKKGPFANSVCLIQLIQVDTSLFFSLPPSWVMQGQSRNCGRFSSAQDGELAVTLQFETFQCSACSLTSPNLKMSPPLTSRSVAT